MALQVYQSVPGPASHEWPATEKRPALQPPGDRGGTPAQGPYRGTKRIGLGPTPVGGEVKVTPRIAIESNEVPVRCAR